MDNNEKFRRTIVYDLGTEELKQFYVPLTKKALTVAYEDLAKVLHDLDFEHRQYSTYVSINELDKDQCDMVYRTICEKLPWFELCFQKFDIVIAQEEYNQYNTIRDMNKEKALEKYNKLLAESKKKIEKSYDNGR